MASALAAGFVLGMAIAASPGPIFFLCVRRNLERGWPSGVASGLGVALADAFYAALAAFGVGTLIGLLLGQRRWLELAGGLALLLLAGRMAVSTPAEQRREWGGTSLASSFGSTLGLTLTNPATILSFAAVFAGLGGRLVGVRQGAAWLVIGVLLGSLAWWTVLAVGLSLLRARLSPRPLRVLQLAAATAVGVFGGVAVVSAITARGV